MKLTVKGGAAVDPDSGNTHCSELMFFSFVNGADESVSWALGLENSAHVLEQGGKMYSATLGLVDIVRGTNSYYKLQLLEDDVQKRCVVSFSTGLKDFPVKKDHKVSITLCNLDCLLD